MKREKEKPYRAAYGTYKGKKLFDVNHPKFGSVCASAPSEDAAIVAAAHFWGENWTKIDFYSECVVTQKA